MTPESPSLRQVYRVYELARAFDGRLYAHVINHYWRRLRELTGDEAIAAHVGGQFNPLQDPQSDLYVTSRTVREGVTRAFEFFNSVNSHSQYSSYAQPGSVMLTVSYPRDLGLLPFDVEWRLSLVAHAIKWFSHELAFDGIQAVSFRRSRPAHDQELIRALGCPVQFDRPIDAVIVDAGVMETPVWGSEGIRLKFSKLVNEVIAEANHASARLSERVAHTIQSGLEHGDSGIKWVAPQLGMSPRTLQRRLEEEGTHYAQILDQARMILCMQLMHAPGINMLNMAKRLGYSSESNFDHAFHRWFGTTPGLFRLMAGGRDSSTRPPHPQTPAEPEASVADCATLSVRLEPGQ